MALAVEGIGMDELEALLLGRFGGHRSHGGASGGTFFGPFGGFLDYQI